MADNKDTSQDMDHTAITMQHTDEDADESESERSTSSDHNLLEHSVRSTRSSTSNVSDESSSDHERQLIPSNNVGRHDSASLYKAVPLLTRAGQCKGRIYDIIMGKLEVLQDNGKWQEFDVLSNSMLESFNLSKKDLQCIIIIESGVVAYYQNDLEKSEQLFDNALKLAEQTVNSVMLQGRAYYLLANVYRHEKRLGKAHECLELSEQLLQLHDSSEDKAELYYTYGNFLLECLSMRKQPSRIIIRKAKEYFERELQLAVACKDERVRRKKMRYAYLKIAQLLLDCRNETARKKSVPLEDALEAKSCLDEIELKLWDFIAYGTKIQFYLARSDQFYRLGSYTKALELSEEALAMIQERGFKKQVNKAKERISHLNQFIRPDFITEIPVEEFVTRINEMTDESGHSADLDSDTTDNETQPRHEATQECVEQL